VTRELKLALIVGFSLVLIVTVLVSDHLSKARHQALAAPNSDLPLAMQPTPVVPPGVDTWDQTPLISPSRAQAATHPVTPEVLPEAASETVEIMISPTATRSSLASGLTLPGFEPVQGTSGSGAVPVPPVREPPQTLASERTHIVADGETLYQIARKYYGNGTSWPKIAQHNGIRAEAIKPGLKLRLPGLEGSLALSGAPSEALPKQATKASAKATETTVRPKYYTVKEGDTLAKISRKVLGSQDRLADLLRINDLGDGDTLSIGQTIRIPNS